MGVMFVVTLVVMLGVITAMGGIYHLDLRCAAVDGF